ATAPRWLKTLHLNRARPRIPNEKSSSRVSSKRFVCASVRTLYTSCLVSEGVSSGNCNRCKCPCTRICGGVFVVMCRSDPSRSTVVFKSSGSVDIFSALSSQFLLHRLPHHFFYRRDAFLHFSESAHSQRKHPVVNRLAAQLETRGTDQNQLSKLLGDFHHFIETDPSLVSGQVAA